MSRSGWSCRDGWLQSSYVQQNLIFWAGESKPEKWKESELIEELKYSSEQRLCCARLHISNKPSLPSCSPGFNLTFTQCQRPCGCPWAGNSNSISIEKTAWNQDTWATPAVASPKAVSALWSSWICVDWCSLHIPDGPSDTTECFLLPPAKTSPRTSAAQLKSYFLRQ